MSRLTTPLPPANQTDLTAPIKGVVKAASPFKISFGGKAATTPAKKADNKYPVFEGEEINLGPEKGIVKRGSWLAAKLKLNEESFDALEAAIKQDKAELTSLALPFYFKTNHGKGDAPSSIAVPSSEGEVLVTFPDKYQAGPPEAVSEVIGEAAMTANFRQTFSIKIKGDELPETTETQELLDKVHEMFAAKGLEGCLEFKSLMVPKKGFSKSRHLIFTPEQNMKLNGACRIITMVKTKARGDKDKD